MKIKVKNKVNYYLIAIGVGGLMEKPTFDFYDWKIITASSEKEALEVYKNLFNCSYFRPSVMIKNERGVKTICEPNYVTYGRSEDFDANVKQGIE